MKNNKIICTIAVLFATTLLIAGLLYLFLGSIESKNVFDFLLYSLVFPAAICAVSLFVIGLINKKYSLASIYAILCGIIVSLEVNIIMLAKLDNEAINLLLENTPNSDTMTITVSNSTGLGSILSSILFFAVCAAIGGAIGAKIAQRGKKKS